MRLYSGFPSVIRRSDQKKWKAPVIGVTLCSYGVMNVINYRLEDRGKMGGVNLCFT